MPNKPNVIECQHVAFKYRKSWVLDNVDFIIRKNEFIGLIGPNGGGKSTLVEVILGLRKPQKGSIKVLDAAPSKSRHHIGYVPQFLNINRDFPALVSDVVGFANQTNLPFRKKFSRSAKNKTVDNALAMTELTALKDTPINELSGGQLQRVFLARALATSPQILILDEPTANIDMHVEKNVFDLLAELNENMTIIVVSHDVGFISDYVSRVACLNRALHWHTPQTVDGGVIQSLYDQPVNMVQHYHGHGHDHG